MILQTKMKLFSSEAFEKKTTTALFIASGVFFVAVVGVFIFFVQEKKIKNESAVLSDIAPVLQEDVFAGVSIEGKSAVVLDASTGKILYEKNSEAELPLASLTKVMTALISTKFSDDTIITIQPEDLVYGAGGLSLGESWYLKDLRNFTLVTSSNSGANAIARVCGASYGESQPLKQFVSLMNSESISLKFPQTFYLNPSGLDVNIESSLSGGYGSAKDMAYLFSYIVKTMPPLLEMTAYDSLVFKTIDGKMHSAENTNIVTGRIPGLLASKTGFTDLAGGNLVIAFNAGPSHPIIVAVLGSSETGRFSDVQKLTETAIKKLGQGRDG